MPKAPRKCPTSGCTNRITHTRYCPEHTTAWAGPRTASSAITQSHEWRALAAEIKRRDNYRCQIQYPGRCTGHATTVDKIKPAARGGDWRDRTNLRAACEPCNLHKARTIDRHTQ